MSFLVLFLGVGLFSIISLIFIIAIAKWRDDSGKRRDTSTRERREKISHD